MPVHAEAVVAVDLGLEVEVEGFGAGFLLAGADDAVPAVGAAVVAVGFEVVAGLNVGGAEETAVATGAEEVSARGGDWDCCTSTFDEPLLHAATVSSRVSPAATVPVVLMPVTTAADRPRFTAGQRPA